MSESCRNEPDLAGCVNSEELARLFDRAFADWDKSAADTDERREAPRIVIGEERGDQARPIFVVGYAFDGHETKLNVRAPFVDISADGLGIVLPQQVPVGAMVSFAFENASAGISHDVAQVTRCDKSSNGFHIGLNFVESARSLD
jgi:hypothetical protein